MNRIPDDWGTAVNVQTMVFGNMGDDCGTGVAFTRDPGTGEPYFYGEYLINAQGEDVVAGIRTPQPITKYQAADSGLKSLEEAMPEVFKELCWPPATASRSTSRTCRTWSSPSSRASSTCSRPATASARPWPASASPSTWSRKA